MLLLRFVFLLSLLASLLPAQTITGTLSGTVQDQHGAGIPGASVSVTSIETGQTRSTTTDATGRYTLIFLPPGSYNLTATAKGFGRASDKQVQLDVARREAVVQYGGLSCALVVYDRERRTELYLSAAG